MAGTEAAEAGRSGGLREVFEAVQDTLAVLVDHSEAALLCSALLQENRPAVFLLQHLHHLHSPASSPRHLPPPASSPREQGPSFVESYLQKERV
jgi:hypothetical protein